MNEREEAWLDAERNSLRNKVAEQDARIKALARDREAMTLLVGRITGTIPVNKIIRASQSGATLIAYFEALHAENFELKTATAKLAAMLKQGRFFTIEEAEKASELIAKYEAQPK